MNYKMLFRDATITFATQIITAISGIIIMTTISRSFGLESYGNYYEVKRVSDILWLFFLFGMTVSIPRNKSFIDKTIHVGAVEIAVLVFPIFSATVYLFFSENLMNLFLEDDKQELIFIINYLVVGMIIYATISSYLRALSNFKALSLYTIVNFSLIPLLPLFYTENIIEYLTEYTKYLLIVNIVFYFIIFMIFIINFSVFSNFILKINGIFSLFKYGILRLPGLFLASLVFTLPVIILSYIGTEKEIGSLGQLFQLFSIVSMPINALGLILLPNFSKIVAEGNIKSLKPFLLKGIKFLTVISLAISVVLMIFLSDILFLINGVRVEFENLILIRILIGMLVPYSIYNFLRNPIDAGNKFPFTTILIFYAFLISVILTIVLYFLLSLSGFESAVILVSSNLLILGLSSLHYTNKLYFNKA